MKKYCFYLILSTLALGCSKNTSNYETVKANVPSTDIGLAKQNNQLAVLLIRGKNYEQAQTELQRAIDAAPEFGPAHNNLGLVYYYQKLYYQAAKEFETTSKLMPNSPQPYNNLGLLWETVAATTTGAVAEEKMNKAIQAYCKAVELDSENPEYLGNLVRARISAGNESEDTRDMLEKLVKIETRTDWRQWAQRTLHSLHNATNEAKPSPLCTGKRTTNHSDPQ